MNQHCPRVSRIVLVVMACALLAGAPGVGAAGTPTPTAGAGPSGGVGKFRAQVKLRPSVFGPADGKLEHDPTLIPSVFAGISVRDLYAKVTITTPKVAPWDAGFALRSGRDADWRLTIDDAGAWSVRIGPGDPVGGGTVDGFAAKAGSKHVLEVVMAGSDGFFAVDGKDAGSFDVSRRDVSGDVGLGTEFSTSTTTEGLTLAYGGFQIWKIAQQRTAAVPDAAATLLEDGRALSTSAAAAFGPSAGKLKETAKSTTIDPAGVSVADFYTRVVFTNPRDAAQRPFDVGIGFRDTGGDKQYRLILASDGTWYLRIGVDPILAASDFAGLDAGAGGKNTVELAVKGEVAVFAVNGKTVAAIPVATLADPGDVAVGSGFYPAQDIVEGDVTAYAEFAVWSFDANAAAASPTAEATSPATVAADASPAVDATPSADAEAIYKRALQEAVWKPIVFGPAKGELKHDATSLSYSGANAAVQDFAVHVQFTNPYAASVAGWDIGLLFRLGLDPQLRLIIDSAGKWYLTPGAADPIQTGSIANLKTETGQSNEIDLVAIGGKGYFGVNGVFVSELDLSKSVGAGDVAVATSFFTGNFQDGASTPYADFLVWSFDEGGTPAAVGTGEATATRTETAPTPPVAPGTSEATKEATAAASTPATAGASYSSPTFGYGVAYDETWSIADQSSKAGVDYLRLTNGTSTVDFTGAASTDTPAACVDAEIASYRGAVGYTAVQIAKDVSDKELRGVTGDAAWAVMWFTYTADGGTATDYTAYVECRPIETGASLLTIVQIVASAVYNTQIDARGALLKGVTVSGGAGTTATAEPSATPTPTPTAEKTPSGTASVTPRAAGAAFGVRLAETDGSGASGLATFSADGKTTNVKVLVIGAPAGALPLIHKGSCDNLDPDPAFLLNEIDAAGGSASTIAIGLDELRAGRYSIAIHAGLDNLSQPIACGTIT